MKRLLHILCITLILGPNPAISAMESGMSDSTSSPEVTRDMDDADSQYASDSESDNEKDSVVDNDEKMEDGKAEESDSDSETSSCCSCSDCENDSDEEVESLQEQCIEKLVQLIQQNADVEKACSMLTRLPDDQALHVLSKFILCGSFFLIQDKKLTPWSYSKKAEMVKKLQSYYRDRANKASDQQSQMQKNQGMDELLEKFHTALLACEQTDTLDSDVCRKLRDMPIDYFGTGNRCQTTSITAESKDKETHFFADNGTSLPFVKTLLFQVKVAMNDITFAIVKKLQKDLENIQNKNGEKIGILFLLDRIAVRNMLKNLPVFDTVTELVQHLSQLPEDECIKVVTQLVLNSPLSSLQLDMLVNQTRIFFKHHRNDYIYWQNLEDRIYKLYCSVPHGGYISFPRYDFSKDSYYRQTRELFSQALKTEDIHTAFKIMALLPGIFNANYACPESFLGMYIENGISFDDSTSDLLYIAIKNGNTELVVELLAANEDPNYIYYCNPNDGSRSANWAIMVHALVLAIVGDHEDIVRLLLDAGVKVNKPCPKTGKLPVEYAYEKGNLHIISMIKAQKSENNTDKRELLDKVMWKQKKRKNAVLKQLPTVEKLLSEARAESSDCFQDFAHRLSLTAQNRQIELMHERYFDKAKFALSSLIKWKIDVLKNEQQTKQKKHADTLTRSKKKVAQKFLNSKVPAEKNQ